MSVQAVSKHLKVLEDAGLVSRSRDAQRRPVHLEAEVFDLMTKWIERYRRQAEERYQRLDARARRARRARRPDDRTHDHPATTRKDTHHDHDAAPHGQDRGRPDGPDDPHHPRLRGDPGPAVPGAHRPRAVRPVGRARPTSSADIDHWDARDGGSLALHGSPSDEFESAFRGCFHRCGPDRIVQTFTWEGMPDGVALETLTFEDLGDGRTRLHATSRCATASRPATLAAPAAWRPASTRATPRSTRCSPAGEL